MQTTILPMQAAHLPALAEIEKACFSVPWSEAALAEELQNPLAVFLTAVDENALVCGYIGMHVVGDEGFITNVAVSPACRRQGVADALIAAVTQYGNTRHLFRITLEVRVSNTPAVSLYEKHGFVRDGVRPQFYSAPKEDATIYSLYF